MGSTGKPPGSLCSGAMNPSAQQRQDGMMLLPGVCPPTSPPARCHWHGESWAKAGQGNLGAPTVVPAPSKPTAHTRKAFGVALSLWAMRLQIQPGFPLAEEKNKGVQQIKA